MKYFVLILLLSLSLFGTADVPEYYDDYVGEAEGVGVYIYMALSTVITVFGLWLIGFPEKLFKKD